ncbi:MAG: vWA domain-containing protein [Phycisphaeraceae bacterium]
MSWWPAKILGIDPARIPPGADTQWVFTHAPQSWRVFVLLAVAIAVAWGVVALYRRETGQIPLRWRLILAGVRLLILALILLILLGPALAISTHRTIEPVVVVLVDDSLSMSVRDRHVAAAESESRRGELIPPAGLTRLQIVERLLTADHQKFLRDLTTRGQVRVMTFSRAVTLRQTLPAQSETRRGEFIRPAEPDIDTSLPRGEPVPPLAAAGQVTDLAGAMRDAARSLAGRPIAGIVLITDGQNTEGDDPLAAADELASQSIPVYPIGVGDPAPPRNLRLLELWAPDSVFRDDPFLIQVQLAAEGFAGRTVPVQFSLQSVHPDGSAGPSTLLETRNVTFTSDNDTQRLRIEHRPNTSSPSGGGSGGGDFILTAAIAPVPDEVLDTDNARSVPVKVLSNHARVLLIAGSPTWDYRLLATLLQRDKTVDLSCWLSTLDPAMRQEGNTVIEHLPRSAEELDKYDLVIMMDPDPAEFDPDWIELLHQFLDQHAGGLMWVAGPKYTGRFLTAPATGSIRDLLPIETGDLTALDIESLVMTHTQNWPLRLTPDGADNVLLRMDKDPKINARLWDMMPGIYWSFPVRDARPGATVLLEHSDPRLRSRNGAMPLLVTGHVGPGRTVYMGFTGSWRWRKIGERYYDQFWVQAVRYLIEGRLLGDAKRGRLSTDRDLYPVGSRVQVTAQLFDASFNPLVADALPALLKGPATPGGAPGSGDQTFDLKPVPNQPGRFQGSVIATQVGLNEIALTLPGGPTSGGVRVAKQLTVDLPRIEFADTRLNSPLLEQLAAKTDGRLVTLDQLDQLPSWLPQRSQTIVIPGRPIDLWDNSRMMFLLLAMLIFEWAMRKRLKMM